MDQIVRHSRLQVQDSLHAGVNYIGLARYFSESHLREMADMLDLRIMSEADLGLETFDGTIHTYGSRPAVRLQNKLVSPQQVSIELQRAQENGGMAFLIFLCGNPSPMTLAGLAVACHLDPEYLRRHLSPVTENKAELDTFFESSAKSWDYDLTLPSLPSTSRNIVQLRYTSIGRSVPHGKQRETDLPGSSGSRVREISSWENRYVSVEQQISICVELLPAQGGERDSWLGKQLAYHIYYKVDSADEILRLHMGR